MKKVIRKTKICPICHNNFEVVPSGLKQKFCKISCKFEGQKKEKTKYKKPCLNCCILFDVSLRGLTSKRKKYCSRNCLYQHCKLLNKHPKIVCQCQKCNKDIFTLKTKPRKFCSSECFQKSRKGTKLSKSHCEIISSTRKRDWAAGNVYTNQYAGRCKWYSFTLTTGEIVRVQGTWELKFVEWLDSNQYEFTVHKGAIWYVDAQQNQRVYLPDFFVKNWNSYVDVKNEHAFKTSKQKFEKILESNPDLKLKILRKLDLINLGIDIK